MAVTLNPGTGGEVIATEDIAGTDYQQVKLVDGTATSTTVIAAGGGVEASALRVTIASDSTGVVSIDDNAGSITVDGTVAVTGVATAANQLADGHSVALSATDNAVLDTIATNTTDAATETTLAAVQTSVQVIDNTILADDAAFTLATSSVNMAGAIRDDALTTLTAVEGDAVPLRVGSTGALHVTGAGGGTQYSIDDAAPTVVTMAGAIRDDALTTLTEADGDASTLRVSSTGALHVTGGGGGTEYSEDVATPATIVGTATMMERDDALASLTPIEGDWAGMRCSANGALWTAIDGSVTVDLGANNDVTVTSGTIAATQSGAWSLTANQSVNVAQMNGVTTTMGNGVSGTGVQRVTLASDSTGQVAVTGAALTALQLIDNPVVAHDAVVGTTQVSMAGFNARSTAQTAVGDGDATRGLATLLGKQVVLPFAIPANTYAYASPAAVADTADDVAKAAAGAGIRNYITGVQVMNGHDTVGTAVVIKDGSTVIWQGWAEQTGGGCSATFNPPLRGTANTAVNVANITTGSSTYFNIQGYIAAE